MLLLPNKKEKRSVAGSYRLLVEYELQSKGSNKPLQCLMSNREHAFLECIVLSRMIKRLVTL